MLLFTKYILNIAVLCWALGYNEEKTNELPLWRGKTGKLACKYCARW